MQDINNSDGVVRPWQSSWSNTGYLKQLPTREISPGRPKQLYLSQSAVSQSLQQLESALGVRLFSRTARGVTLTAEGSVLYDYAEQALSLLEAGEARIAQSRELLKGELSIGVSSTLTKYYLLPFLRDYHQQYPHIHVRILNGTSRRVLQLLGSGQVELAFATYTPDADSFSIFPVL